MDTLKKNLVHLVAATLVCSSLVSCGDDDNKKKKGSEPTLWEASKFDSRFECSSLRRDLKITLELRNSESPLVAGDQLAQVEIEASGVDLKLDLLLGMRFRTDRGVIQVRKALEVRDPELSPSESNLNQADDFSFGTHILNYDFIGEEMVIISEPLKALIRDMWRSRELSGDELEVLDRDRGRKNRNSSGPIVLEKCDRI